MLTPPAHGWVGGETDAGGVGGGLCGGGVGGLDVRVVPGAPEALVHLDARRVGCLAEVERVAGPGAEELGALGRGEEVGQDGGEGLGFCRGPDEDLVGWELGGGVWEDVVEEGGEAGTAVEGGGGAGAGEEGAV